MTKDHWRRMGLVLPVISVLSNGTAIADPAGPSGPLGRPGLGSDLQRASDDYCRGPGNGNCGPIRHGAPLAVPGHRIRQFGNVMVTRPYGHLYPGYGNIYTDDDAYKWLAFTSITLRLLDILNEQQQRAHEAAQVRATTAAVGETVIWNEGSAAGSVTVLREGTSTRGRYCREFQQEVIIGGQSERAYGTACRQPDGAWEIISTGG